MKGILYLIVILTIIIILWSRYDIKIEAVYQEKGCTLYMMYNKFDSFGNVTRKRIKLFSL